MFQFNRTSCSDSVYKLIYMSCVRQLWEETNKDNSQSPRSKTLGQVLSILSKGQCHSRVKVTVTVTHIKVMKAITIM